MLKSFGSIMSLIFFRVAAWVVADDGPGIPVASLVHDLSELIELTKLVATSYHFLAALCSKSSTARSNASPKPHPFASATRVNASIVSGFSLRFS